MKNFIAVLLATLSFNALSQIPDYVPTEGLVGWYPFNGSALNSADLSEVVSVNGPVLSEDRFGAAASAFYFDGIDDDIITSNVGIEGRGITLSFWYKTEQVTRDAYMVAYGGNSWGTYFEILNNHWSAQTPGPCYSPALTGGGTLISRGGDAFPDANSWHHTLVILPEAAQSLLDAKFYFDGEEQPETCSFANYGAPQPFISNANPMKFGSGYQEGSWTNSYEGFLDDVGIWNRALTDEEILALFESPNPSIVMGCTDETACNFNEEANSNDGSCIPSGCMDPEACNFNDLAECEGEACDYSCPEIPVYVPTNGLVAWFPFNGNANDESLNGHDADVDGATLSMDRFGNSESAYVFDGNDRIFPSNPEGFPVAERTTSIWMKSNVEVTGGRALFGYGGGSCGSSWLLTYNNQGNQPLAYHSFELQGHCNAFGTAASLPSSEFLNWHHVVLRTSEEGTDIFVDGVLTTQSTTFVNNTQPNCAVLGAVPSPGGACVYQDSSNDLWNGLLDDFAIWDRALTDQEIELLYFSDFETGCTDSNACNFDAAATLDDGSCLAGGCTYPDACNFDPLAACDDGSCDYSCCPGPGCCTDGMYWDWELEGCYLLNAADINMDGCVQLNDLLDLLGSYGNCDLVSSFQCGDVFGYLGYDYATVQIGEQCWFAENLRATAFRNGQNIPEFQSNLEWSLNQASPARSVILINAGDDEEEYQTNLSLYGRSYNGIAVLDERGLCPAGWHIPSTDEWTQLRDAVGEPAGVYLKASASDTPGWNGNNESGWSGLPGGNRGGNGSYNSSGIRGYWWSSTSTTAEDEAPWLDFTALQTDVDGLYFDNTELSTGNSVRCVKDAE